MRKNKKHRKHIDKNVEVWTEEEYEEYLMELYGMKFIAGFTEGGVPYGLFNEEEEEINNGEKLSNPNEPYEELPF